MLFLLEREGGEGGGGRGVPTCFRFPIAHTEKNSTRGTHRMHSMDEAHTHTLYTHTLIVTVFLLPNVMEEV